MGFNKPSAFRPSGKGDSVDHEYDSRREVERKLGEDGRLMSSAKVLKSIKTEMYYYRRKEAIFVWSGAASKSGAASYGKKIQKNFIARSKIPYDAPPVHDWALYVGYEGGYVVLPKLEKAKSTRKPRETNQDIKNRMYDKAEEAFGDKSTKIQGKGSNLIIIVKPTDPDVRDFHFKFQTMKEGEQKLDKAIEMLARGKLKRAREEKVDRNHIARELLSVAKSLKGANELDVPNTSNRSRAILARDFGELIKNIEQIAKDVEDFNSGRIGSSLEVSDLIDLIYEGRNLSNQMATTLRIVSKSFDAAARSLEGR
jgi:hypothetical protein